MKSKIRWWTEEDGTHVYIHEETDPEKINSSEEEIMKLATSHGSTENAVIGTSADSDNHVHRDHLIANGYSVVFHKVVMTRPAESESIQALLPQGLDIRDVTPHHHRIVYDANKSIYAGQWGNSLPSNDDFREFIEESADTTLWTVAWDGDSIAGFVLSSIDGETGDLNEVTVMSNYRRKGLAQYLLKKNFEELQKRGVTMIRLHTDARGSMGGRQLYEKVGFKAIKELYRLRKPLR